MKKLICFLFSLLFSVNSYTQIGLTENQKLESLCKVWGFLKYFHPAVTKGKIDWDLELVKLIPKVTSTKDKAEMCDLYLNWIRSLGKVTKCGKCQKSMIPDNFKYNLNLDWIEDNNFFSDSIITELVHIRENPSQKTNYYSKQTLINYPISFENEKPYNGMVFPCKEYRLLSLFRFWNVINYYYPYKYVIGEDWNNVLTKMIDQFKNSKDTVEYHLAMTELTATLNDSHSGLFTGYSFRFFGFYAAPFKIKIINEKAVVIGFHNDTLSNLDDIRKGDIIFKVNNKPLSEIITERSRYICASNLPTKLEKLSNILLNGNSDSAQITVDRNGKIYNKTFHRYKHLHLNWSEDTCSMVKTLNNNIGYINLGKLPKNKVHQVLKQMRTMQAIIFDVRNNAHMTGSRIAKYINQTKKPFVVSLLPLKGHPGIFRYTNPQFCGSKNSSYYKGKIILLVNERTQSHGEYTCMALQTANNVTVIGDQTAGADGSVVYFTYPGGYKTRFTSVGIFYPDGRETQRIGIIPNIKVAQTIDGIRLGKDEILDRAIQFVSNGK